MLANAAKNALTFFNVGRDKIITRQGITPFAKPVSFSWDHFLQQKYHKLIPLSILKSANGNRVRTGQVLSFNPHTD